MPGTRIHPPISVLALSENSEETPILRVADHAIGLWYAAEALGDTVLLEALRPLLLHVGRILAREVVNADGDETPQ